MADVSNIGIIVSRGAEFTDFHQAADQMGFHSLWVTGGMFQSVSLGWAGGGGPEHPFTVLAAAAAATSRIRLGTGVMRDLMRDPVALASELARLDRLSNGRLVLGVSQSDWPGEHEQPIGSTLWARRGARAEELITLLKRLWAEDEVTFQGGHFRVQNASISERPVQPGGVPILVGGASLASVRLAATLADGWVHPSGGIPEQLLLYCATVKYLALEAKRDPSALELEKVIYLAIDDDKAQARRRLTILQQYYSRGYIVNYCCAYGPPADCAAFIRRTLESGIKRVLVCLMSPDVAELERLRREVIPLLE